MSGLYTRTGTQLRVGGNGDVKEVNKVVCMPRVRGNGGNGDARMKNQGSVYRNSKHRVGGN